MKAALLAVAWPAFMAACALELVVFAFADPMDLHWAGERLAWSRQGVYTLAFFVFWMVSAAACAFTTLLRLTPGEVNDCPFDPSQRPEGCPAVRIEQTR